MANIYSAVVLPTGELKIEDKEIIIANCQIVASTPQNALETAFIIKKVNCQNEESKARTEQPCEDVKDVAPILNSSNNSLNVMITNKCIENAKVNLKVDRSRLISVEDNQGIWCQNTTYVEKSPDGFLLKGHTTVTKEFVIGETVVLKEGDTVSINNQTIIEFKCVEEEKKLDVEDVSTLFSDW